MLFEGAQGTLLDIDHGTYPFITSSSTTAGGACTGTGVPPTRIHGALGIAKAYTTRVGGGPFPTEVSGDTAAVLRTRGNEFGSVTGRPRRCGWADAVALRYAVRINGLDALAVTKLDVLDAFDAVKIGVGYRYRGEVLTDFPGDEQIWPHAEPVYEELSGWQTLDPRGPRREGAADQGAAVSRPPRRGGRRRDRARLDRARARRDHPGARLRPRAMVPVAARGRPPGLRRARSRRVA